MKKILALFTLCMLFLMHATTIHALIITGKVYELPDMIPSQHVVVHISNVVGHGTTTDQHGHFLLNITGELPEKIDLEIHSVYRIGIRIINIQIAGMDTLHLDKLHIFKPDRKVLPKYGMDGSSASGIDKKHKIPKTQEVLINRKHYQLNLNLKEERYELDMGAE
jgi:hypothetical protein